MSHFTHTDYKWTNAVRPGISVNEGEEKRCHAVASAGSGFPVPVSISQREGYHPAPGVFINAFCTGQREAVRKLKSKCWLLHFCYRRCSFLSWHQLFGDKHRPAQRYSQTIFLFFFFFKVPSTRLEKPFFSALCLPRGILQTSQQFSARRQNTTVLSLPRRSRFTAS